MTYQNRDPVLRNRPNMKKDPMKGGSVGVADSI